MSKDPVILCDVAPRDGFQVVPTWIPTETKIRVIEGLAAAGMKRIEAGAFVSPKHVPQMSQTNPSQKCPNIYLLSSSQHPQSRRALKTEKGHRRGPGSSTGHWLSRESC